MSLLSAIMLRAVRQPSRIAVIDDLRTYSYGKLLGAAMFIAQRIEQLTDKPHVGIMLPTTGGAAASILGCWLARRTCVPLNFLLAPDELRYIIDHSQVDTVLSAGLMLDFMGDNPALRANVNFSKLEAIDFKAVPPLRWPPMIRPQETAALLYTSGTSGKPKGVVLSHGNLESNVKACLTHAKLTSQDKMLGVLPQFHAFGLTVLTLLPLYTGLPVVFASRFTPKKIIDLMREHRPTAFVAVPSMFGALLTAKDAKPDDFSSLRYCVSGAEPLPDAVFEDFAQRFGVCIQQGYGLTEMSPVTHWATDRRIDHRSVGRALPGVVCEVVDDQMNFLPQGEEGEILLAGPNRMQGYYREPELNKQVLLTLDHPQHGPTTFFRTGDIGRVDDDGALFITGRKKEMLIIGGENVFPREIEEVLVKHASVAAAAVVGQADPVRGEVPVAFVELVEGASFDEAELKQFCKPHLAGYKIPRQIHQAQQMPRSPTGKILRRKLTVPQ